MMSSQQNIGKVYSVTSFLAKHRQLRSHHIGHLQWLIHGIAYIEKISRSKVIHGGMLWSLNLNQNT